MLAIGILDIFRREDERPQTPCNFAGDYAGGGTMLAMGVLLALLERAQSGKGQVSLLAVVCTLPPEHLYRHLLTPHP